MIEDMKKSRYKSRHKFITLIAAVVILVLAVSIIIWKSRKHTAYDTVVFKVGNEEVRLDEINLCILQNVLDMGIDQQVLSTGEANGMSADEYYKEEILKMIMDYKVENIVAANKGISLTDDEKKSATNDAIDYLGKVNSKVFNELGITRDRIVEIYKQRRLSLKLEASVEPEEDIKDQRFVTIYLMMFPKVQMDGNGGYVTEEDGITPVMLSDDEIMKRKEDAEAAYKELTEEGADALDVADKYGVLDYSGEESNMEDSFEEPFSEYAKKLSEGEYSEVLDLSSCYAIVKMVQENNEEYASQIMNQYRMDMQKEELEKQIDKWYEEADISIEPEFIGNRWEHITLYDFVKYVQ